MLYKSLLNKYHRQLKVLQLSYLENQYFSLMTCDLKVCIFVEYLNKNQIICSKNYFTVLFLNNYNSKILNFL